MKKTEFEKRMTWFVMAVVLVISIGVLFMIPVAFLSKSFFFLLSCCLVSLIRVFVGPSAVDRAAAITITGMMVIGFCAILAILTGNGWYIDIAFIWVLQSFIVTLSLAKFLEGKRFDQ